MKLPNIRLPKLNAFAKAQAWGLAVGFALALYATDKLGYGIRLYLVATGLAWVAWEYFLGSRAPSHRKDIAAMAYGIGSGFILPWIGFAVAAGLFHLRP